MPFSMEYLQHVLHKNISRQCKDKGLLKWNHQLTVHDSFPSTSIQGHRVEFLLCPIDPLSMEPHHFFTIFILEKTT
jgi:hypothetical protein